MPEEKKNSIRLLSVYRFSDLGMEDVEGAPDLSEALKIREVEYDEKGHVLREVEYTEEAEPGEMFLRTYDEKGNLAEMQHFYEGQLSEKTTYTYNNNGLVSSETLEYADGGRFHTQYTYDGENNLIEKKVTDDDGSMDSLEVSTYDGKRLVEILKYDSEHNLKESRKLTYRSDKPDVVQEEVSYEADADLELRTVYLDDEAGSITYNKEGKVHTRQKVVYDEKKRIAETLISTYSGSYHYQYGYDEKDNVIEEVRTVGGTIFFKALIRYNEQGSIDLRSVTEMNSGLFTDMYRYEYFS
jgi:YD repeat-containing protein